MSHLSAHPCVSHVWKHIRVPLQLSVCISMACKSTKHLQRSREVKPQQRGASCFLSPVFFSQQRFWKSKKKQNLFSVLLHQIYPLTTRWRLPKVVTCSLKKFPGLNAQILFVLIWEHLQILTVEMLDKWLNWLVKYLNGCWVISAWPNNQPINRFSAVVACLTLMSSSREVIAHAGHVRSKWTQLKRTFDSCYRNQFRLCVCVCKAILSEFYPYMLCDYITFWVWSIKFIPINISFYGTDP